MNSYSVELPWRIKNAQPDSTAKHYSLYVRWGRLRLGLDRAALAKRTGLPRDFLTFLENALLLGDELTKEVRANIEEALGISYREFLNQWLSGSLEENSAGEKSGVGRPSGHQLRDKVGC